MKKNLIKFVAFAIFTTTLFAVTNPSIEGRAVVAQQGELPPGMYVKAHSFLPGDSVIITNLSTKTSIEVFVFERIDTGVAAVVSQEVADKLFISENSDSLVQMRKVVVLPSVAEQEILKLSEKNNQKLVDIQESAEEEMLVISEEIAKELESEQELTEPVEITEISELTEPVELAIVDNISEETEYIPEITENVAEIEELEDETVFTPFSDMNTMFPPVVSEVADQEAVGEEEIIVQEEIVAIEEPVVEEKLLEEIIVQEEAVVEEEPLEEIIVQEEIVAIEEPVVEEKLLEEIIVQEEIVAIEEAVVEEEPLEEIIVQEEIVAIEEPVVEELPNVLVPAEANPAIALDTDPEVVFIEDFFDSNEDDYAEEVQKFEVIDAYALKPAVEEIAEIDFAKYLVDDIKIIDSKKYYVQLATYKNQENIANVINSYSEKYPFALVESQLIENAYQVVVGPLTGDEYTIVLERFKAHGFKDAFLKVAK